MQVEFVERSGSSAELICNFLSESSMQSKSIVAGRGECKQFCEDASGGYRAEWSKH
jgi:hypothetical protein